MFCPTRLVPALLIASLAGTALADGVVSISGAAAGYGGGNGGGAFTATTVSGYNGQNIGPASTDNSFQTFCLQENEFVNPNGTNYNTIIANHTVLAGRSNYDPSTSTSGPIAGQDAISATTALLFTTFVHGGSFGILDTSNTTALATALQLAIWYSEGELFDGTNTFDNYSVYDSNQLAKDLFVWARDNNNGTTYDVAVMQMYNQDVGNTNAQDMLTIVPLPPAAYAGLSTLAGVIGLGYIRRRRLANI